jgi:hypothetical protein
MYVPDYCQVSVDFIFKNAPKDDEDINWQHLLQVDYAFHCLDSDYDGGLSFLDRLNKKLRFTNDIATVKNSIDSIDSYLDTIQNILNDPKDIAYYGY